MGADKIRANNLKLKFGRRKGIIYSLLTLLLLTPSIILLISYFNTVRTEGQDLTNRIRADDLNSFYRSLLEDLSRSLKISTQRAILHSNQVILTTGTPFLNSSQSISEMVLNGTLDGDDVPLLKNASSCNTVLCWKDNYIYIADRTGYNLSIKVVSVSTEPYDSWNLNSSAKIEISLKDLGTNSIINHTITQSSKVPITGFEDPLYLLNTNGQVSRSIKKPTTPPLVRGSVGSGWAIGTTTTITSDTGLNKTLVIDTPTVDLRDFGSAIFESSATTTLVPFINNATGAVSTFLSPTKVFIENVTYSVWNLQSERSNGIYHESYSGPSYLDRLEGRTSISDSRKGMPNVIGLVSFIDSFEFALNGLVFNQSLSCADYLYFSGNSSNLC